MKGTDTFKEIIETYLNGRAEKDPLFADTLAKPNKNIDDCVSYILNTVQKSGCAGFADEEVFGMAVHYYDEDDIKPGGKSNAQVIVNHRVELSEDEIKAAKDKALELAIEEQKKKLTTKKKPSKEEDSTQISLF